MNESRGSVAGYVDVEGDRVPMAADRRGRPRGALQRTSAERSTASDRARRASSRGLIVRGSFSTGFRAPSLGQSFFSSTATNFLNLGQGLVPVESLTLPVGSAAARALGASPLKPETRSNASGGVVLTPAKDLELAVDYYRITIDDRIVLSGNFTAPPIAALLAPFGANSARFFTNAIDTRTNGVDATRHIASAWRRGRPSPPRRLQQQPHTRSRADRDPAATRRVLERCCSITSSRGGSNAASRRDNLRLGGNWQRGAFGVNVDEARYGEVCSFATQNPAEDQRFGAKWLTDVEASVRSRTLLARGRRRRTCSTCFRTATRR